MTALFADPGAGPSDFVQVALAVIAFAGVVFNGLLGYLMFRLKVNSDAAAVATERVRTTLESTTERTDDKLDGLAVVAKDTNETGKQIHILTNANMGLQLKVGAVALRRVADLTRDPGDVAAAELAEKSLEEHEAKQASVDRRDAAATAGD